MFQFLVVKLFGPHDGLRCVVDQNVQFCNVSVDVVDQSTHLHLRQEIALQYVQIALPLLVILLLLVTQQAVLREAGGQVDCRSVPQQLHCDLEPNFYASACHQGVHALQVCLLGALGVVELGAGRTELAVEEVDLSVGTAADVASDFVRIPRLFLDDDGITVFSLLNILGELLEFAVELVVVVLFGAVDFGAVPGLLDPGPFLLGGFLLGLADGLALVVFLVKEVAHPGEELVAPPELAFEEVNLPQLVHLVQFLHGP